MTSRKSETTDVVIASARSCSAMRVGSLLRSPRSPSPSDRTHSSRSSQMRTARDCSAARGITDETDAETETTETPMKTRERRRRDDADPARKRPPHRDVRDDRVRRIVIARLKVLSVRPLPPSPEHRTPPCAGSTSRLLR